MKFDFRYFLKRQNSVVHLIGNMVSSVQECEKIPREYFTYSKTIFKVQACNETYPFWAIVCFRYNRNNSFPLFRTKSVSGIVKKLCLGNSLSLILCVNSVNKFLNSYVLMGSLNDILNSIDICLGQW